MNLYLVSNIINTSGNIIGKRYANNDNFLYLDVFDLFSGFELDLEYYLNMRDIRLIDNVEPLTEVQENFLINPSSYNLYSKVPMTEEDFEMLKKGQLIVLPVQYDIPAFIKYYDKESSMWNIINYVSGMVNDEIFKARFGILFFSYFEIDLVKGAVQLSFISSISESDFIANTMLDEDYKKILACTPFSITPEISKICMTVSINNVKDLGITLKKFVSKEVTGKIVYLRDSFSNNYSNINIGIDPLTGLVSFVHEECQFDQDTAINCQLCLNKIYSNMQEEAFLQSACDFKYGQIGQIDEGSVIFFSRLMLKDDLPAVLIEEIENHLLYNMQNIICPKGAINGNGDCSVFYYFSCSVEANPVHRFINVYITFLFPPETLPF